MGIFVVSRGEKRDVAELLGFGLPLGDVLCGDILGILELKFAENSFGNSIFPKPDFNQPYN